jgi:UDP-N-acetylmuramoyl-L-alanyl-D-glutamate--2,6-diaminopimelate ligase
MSNSIKKLLTEFKYIEQNSVNIKKGSIFLAYPGEKNDGRNYIEEAINRGAGAIIYDPLDFEWNNQWDLPKLPVKNLKDNISDIASQFFNNPSQKIKLIGVTGTNGKTSSVYWITQCLTHLKRKAAMISTIGYGFIEKLEPTANTTPDAIKIQSIINSFGIDMVQDACIEVSSHGIKQGRVSGVNFDVRLFTNLSRDHLDYHDSIESYAKIKKEFLLDARDGNLVVNIDDPLGKEIFKESALDESQKISFGIDNVCLLQAKNIISENKITKFNLTYKDKTIPVIASVAGKYNVYNILGVVGVLISLGHQIENIGPVLKNLNPVPGRAEVLETGLDVCPKVIIDFAHTSDALKNILESLKLLKYKNLNIVFGCGGDRDKGKRKEMAAVVNRYADFVIVTSDNPRNEEPLKIIDDICQNITIPHIAIEDREEAIKEVLKKSNIDDLILIAGKGHETYQEIKGIKKKFSDKLIAKKYVIRYFGAKN